MAASARTRRKALTLLWVASMRSSDRRTSAVEVTRPSASARACSARPSNSPAVAPMCPAGADPVPLSWLSSTLTLRALPGTAHSNERSQEANRPGKGHQ